MMEYRLQQIFLKGLERYYLLLPKLNEPQLALLAKRLRDVGFQTKVGSRIRATLRQRALTIERSGLAWSNMDILDPLAPIIPSLLALEKTRVGENPYFVVKRADGKYRVQLFTRMESLRLWTELRKQDSCGLTPDEFAIVASILEGADGMILGVADYPSELSKVVQFGAKVYYLSRMDVGEFLLNLRTIEQKRTKNTYLPRHSIIETQLVRAPSGRVVAEMVDSLGQWCFVTL